MGSAPVKLALNHVILFLCTVTHLAQVIFDFWCFMYDRMQPSVFASSVTDEIHLNSKY
jgi:hypothetical protein